MPNKSLGQHWLHDPTILSAIADAAQITTDDTVLEIGPGLGTLTSQLLKRAKRVVAVEFDSELARKLPAQFPGKDLEVINEDILHFDLSTLPVGYKVVANVPYYITSKIVQKLMTASHKPANVVLLVQKEVAERIAANAGNMSILGISAQVFARTTLDIVVPARYFTPPPKVDSQVVVLEVYQKPLYGEIPEKDFFRVVKAGFSAKRKKLRSSLSGGLAIDKKTIEAILAACEIDASARAEDLSIKDWCVIARSLNNYKSAKHEPLNKL